MKCTLCDGSIETYDTEFSQLKIDEQRAVYICETCIDKFMKWQTRKTAVLFPTKALKKLYKK
jgi:hypothetical protein